MPTKQEVNNTVAITNPEALGPEGVGIGGSLSFARLNKAAGPLAKDTQEPQLCGWITGFVQSISEPEKGDYGDYQRIIGEFFGLPFNRSIELTATELFLPATAQRFVEAALKSHGPGVPIRLEGWAYPDMGKRPNPYGYVYRVFLRQPPGVRSAARQLAEQAGIVAPLPAPPPLQLPAHDLETGEVKDSLDDMIGSSRNAGQARTEAGALAGAK